MGQLKSNPPISVGGRWLAHLIDEDGDTRGTYFAHRRMDWDEERDAREGAAALAAGWNLLELLEKMEAVQDLDAIAEGCAACGRDLSARKIRAVSAAIRTALESKQ